MAAISKMIGLVNDWHEQNALVTALQVRLPRAQSHVAGIPNPLQLSAIDTKVLTATPVKRRGKSMFRRTGQSGHIESSGRWWVVRWWMDTPGLEKRKHMRERICPISGPGSLPGYSGEGEHRFRREGERHSGAKVNSSRSEATLAW